MISRKQFSTVIVYIFYCTLVGGAADIKYKAVNDGSSIELPCSFGADSKFIRWSHLYVGDSIERDIHVNITENYEVKCNADKSSCDLRVIQASHKSSAGKYSCRVFNRITGMSDTASKVELIVVDLKCNSNIKTGQSMLGKNDCKVEPDVLERSCSYSYNGNNDSILQLGWKRNKNGNVDVNKDHEIILSRNVTTEKLYVTKEMNGVVFQCYIKNFPEIMPCSLPELFVEYVHKRSQETAKIQIDGFQNYSCSVDKSTDVQCTYFWNGSFNRNHVIIENQILSKKDVNLSMTYVCIANCNFGKSKNCEFETEKLRFVNMDQKSNLVTIVVISVLIPLALVVIIIIALILFKKKRTNRTQARNGTSAHEIEPLNVQESNDNSVSNNIDTTPSKSVKEQINFFESKQEPGNINLSESSSVTPKNATSPSNNPVKDHTRRLLQRKHSTEDVSMEKNFPKKTAENITSSKSANQLEENCNENPSKYYSENPLSTITLRSDIKGSGSSVTPENATSPSKNPTKDQHLQTQSNDLNESFQGQTLQADTSENSNNTQKDDIDTSHWSGSSVTPENATSP